MLLCQPDLQSNQPKNLCSLSHYLMMLYIKLIIISQLTFKIYSGPLADSHEIKRFFIKAILGKIKVASLKF